MMVRHLVFSPWSPQEAAPVSVRNLLHNYIQKFQDGGEHRAWDE